MFKVNNKNTRQMPVAIWLLTLLCMLKNGQKFGHFSFFQKKLVVDVLKILQILQENTCVVVVFNNY